jgi:hypothetical protein
MEAVMQEVWSPGYGGRALSTLPQSSLENLGCKISGTDLKSSIIRKKRHKKTVFRKITKI